TTRTDHYFAWTIANPMTAAFLGAFYWTAIPLAFLSAGQRVGACPGRRAGRPDLPVGHAADHRATPGQVPLLEPRPVRERGCVAVAPHLRGRPRPRVGRPDAPAPGGRRRPSAGGRAPRLVPDGAGPAVDRHARRRRHVVRR